MPPRYALFFLALYLLFNQASAFSQNTDAERRLCQRVMHSLVNHPHLDPVDVILSSAVTHGHIVRDESNYALPLVGKMFAPRGPLYSFHSMHQNMYWALQLPRSKFENPWQLLTPKQKGDLVRRVSDVVGFAKYDEIPDELESQVLQTGFGPALAAHFTKGPDIPPSQLFKHFGLGLIGVAGHLVGWNTPGLYLMKERVRMTIGTPEFQAALNAPEQPRPTGLAPSAYIAEAVDGNWGGNCRMGAMAGACLLGELGASPREISLSGGFRWRRKDGHGWAVHSADWSLPRQIQMVPSNHFDHYSWSEFTLGWKYPLRRLRTKILKPVFRLSEDENAQLRLVP